METSTETVAEVETTETVAEEISLEETPEVSADAESVSSEAVEPVVKKTRAKRGTGKRALAKAAKEVKEAAKEEKVKEAKKEVKRRVKRQAHAKEVKDAEKRRNEPKSGQSGPPLTLFKEKLNPKELQVATFLAADINPIPINALASAVFPTEKPGTSNSWVRNSLRRLVRGHWVDKVGKGTYRLSEAARSWLEGTSVPAEPQQPAASAQ